MKEFEAQKNIMDIAKKIKNLPEGERGLRAYQELAYLRFYELLSNAFPIFFEIVDKKEFEKSIYLFMQYGAKSPYIWQAPNEFRNFVKKKKWFKTMKYVDDLLWFEWIEIQLMMKNYNHKNIDTFDHKAEYKRSLGCAIQKITYKVHEKSFDEAGTFFLLAYYDLDHDEVYFREISQILFIFLQKLNSNGIKKSVKILSELTGETQKKVEDFLKPTLKELCKLGVLRKKNKRK